MLGLDEIIAEAEATERETADIEVVFHTGISREIAELREQEAELTDRIEAIASDLTAELEQIERDRRAGDHRPGVAKKRAETATAELQAQLDLLTPKIEDAERRAAEYLVTFRITALHGFEWDELRGRSPARDGSAEDASVGFNIDEVTRVVMARSAVRVAPDGKLIDITNEQWDGIWKTLPAFGRRQLKQAVWVLHELATTMAMNEAVTAARKVSTAQQADTRPSPSDSASTPDVSADGSPRRSRTTSTKKVA